MNRLGALATLGSFVALVAASADAAPPSPTLSAAASRQSAREAVARVAMHAAMDQPDKGPALEGLYAAFDPTPTDLIALAACDDDGDPVVVLSDALLALVDTAAQAEAIDDTFGTHKVDDYAAFLGRTQAPSARTLPPPPGFFQAAQTNDPRVKARAPQRRDAMIAALVAHEVAHVEQGDVTCPHPSAEREVGDAEWTRAEARAAMEHATQGAYAPARVLSADASGIRLVLATSSDGAPPPEDADAALIALFERLPASAYARLHQVPGTTTAGMVRAQVVRAAATHWRQRHH